MNQHGWRPRDFWFYVALLILVGLFAVWEVWSLALFIGGLALLQLVEMTIHAISDAFKGDA